MIYIVLGMHKSGTTLVSQTLHLSGIDMGDGFDANVYYDLGHKYEREETWRLNEDILAASDLHSIMIRRPPALKLSLTQKQAMKQIIEDNCARHKDWGFKDPRTCLIYPEWEMALPPHKLIVVYRRPAASWHRYRSSRRLYRRPREARQFLESWRLHNEAILESLRSRRHPAIVLEYNALMQGDTELARLSWFVGRELVDRRRPERYRKQLPSYPVLTAVDWWQGKRSGRTTNDILTELAEWRQEMSEPVTNSKPA